MPRSSAAALGLVLLVGVIALSALLTARQPSLEQPGDRATASASPDAVPEGPDSPPAGQEPVAAPALAVPALAGDEAAPSRWSFAEERELLEALREHPFYLELRQREENRRDDLLAVYRRHRPMAVSGDADAQFVIGEIGRICRRSPRRLTPEQVSRLQSDPSPLRAQVLERVRLFELCRPLLSEFPDAVSAADAWIASARAAGQPLAQVLSERPTRLELRAQAVRLFNAAGGEPVMRAAALRRLGDVVAARDRLDGVDSGHPEVLRLLACAREPICSIDARLERIPWSPQGRAVRRQNRLDEAEWIDRALTTSGVSALGL